MNSVDIAVLVLLGLALLSGLRNGFVIGVLSLLGLAGGAAGGLQAAGAAVRSLPHGWVRVGTSIALILVCAAIGEIIAVRFGRFLRGHLTIRPARMLDSVLGALVSGVALLLVVWMVAVPLASSGDATISNPIQDSKVITAVDNAMPGEVRRVYSSAREALARRGLPTVTIPLGDARVRQVPAPSAGTARSAGVRSAAPSVVQVTGVAARCSRQLEGSGFVYAPDRVLTNAHVVAGVSSVRVEVGGDSRPGRIVVYDPNRDLAVIAVSTAGVHALRFATAPARPGSPAAVAGFPEDGPYRAVPARVRFDEQIRGPNIYGTAVVVRSVYTIRGRVRPGNSGGPLLATDGAVLGIVFAAASDDGETGYALTAAEVAPDTTAGAESTASVGTGRCT